ncbi:hypothetical protein [Cohnella silvisoli]|uniref:Uncharacterized protein n=1 Tax=Cohnella silvisoli TaxID=2873699 RepID=A0ABV1KRY7_9BACL|nr:hypothetical protein [Cohnella silvisoli]MCD9022426.1 hypothetical protein [Cohnella silvisoli]
MREKTIVIITNADSDLSALLERSPVNTVTMTADSLKTSVLDACSAVAILGGTEEKPLLFHPRERMLVEKQLQAGKRIFAEYCGSIGHVYSEPPVSTRFERVVFTAEKQINGVLPGDILDEQCNTRIRPHDIACTFSRPILQYARGKDHSSSVVDEKLLASVSDRALWFDEPENLLICSFRMANFKRARFSPNAKWEGIVKFILEWLCEESVPISGLNAPYRFEPFQPNVPLEVQTDDTIGKAIGWFEEAGMLLNMGKDGVQEGFGTEVYADGTQRLMPSIRIDCVAEVSMAYFMHGLLTKDKRSLDISDNLMSVCFDLMQIKEQSPLKGMLRWTQEAWGVCYQDDAARVLIPQLLKCLYTGSTQYLQECADALDFLVRTTGTDGLRPFRTDNIDLTEEKIRKLSSAPARFYCAHYNAFYHGALLLAYKLTGNERYKEVGVRGLESLMSVYPNTRREYSETQEMCRLIMPLSWLYWVTGEGRHKEWLYGVTEDLKRLRHPSGGYLEWDTGYQADRSNSKDGEESTMLTRNGDPIVDLLYSLNWLPTAFAQAYFVTKDDSFKELCEDMAKFLISTQVHSDNKTINGGWARALDVDMLEVYGLPADVGWGPWAIESGWTVAEIASGLTMWRLEKELIKHYG